MNARHDRWRTPPAFFDVLDREFGFELDAAASHENTLCSDFLAEADDALVIPWLVSPHGRVPRAVYVNPPYTRLGAFVQRAYEQSQEHHTTVVLLIPAYTDPRYWSEYVMQAHEVRFLKGRLSFVDVDGQTKMSARFPSVVVVFKWIQGAHYGKAPHQWTWDWRASL